MSHFLCFLGGVAFAVGGIFYLLIRSHRNFTAMCHANPKDK